MTVPNERRTRLGACPMLLAALLAACSGQQTPERFVAAAQASLAKGDAAAAAIQAKNALSLQQDSGEARLMLGRALLAAGKPTEAVVELRKAVELKQSPSGVSPPLARALLAERQFQKVIDEFGSATLPDPAAAADVQATLANAYLALRNVAAAQKACEAALAQVPDHPRTLLVMARIAASQKRFDDALKHADKVIAATPGDADAWLFKGDVLSLVKGDRKGAIEVYRKVLAIDPRNVAARGAVTLMLIEANDLKGADAELAELKRLEPLPLQVKYFEAHLAFLRGDQRKATEAVQQVQRAAPDNVRTLVLAGEIALADNALVAAQRSFSKALTLEPQSQPARLALARAYLRLGQTAQAQSTIKPLLANPSGNAAAEAIAGQASMESGDFAGAAQHYARAVEQRPGVANRTALAVAQLKQGKGDAAIEELRKLAAESKMNTAPDVALVNALLNKRDSAGALAATDAIEKKQPGKAATADMRARIYLLQEDLPAARKEFERTINIDPVYMPAVVALAKLDFASKQPAAARKRFDTVLAIEPANLAALLGVVGIRKAEGAPPKELNDMLRNVIRLNPEAAAPRLQLIESYLVLRDAKSALTAALEAEAALPDNLEVLDVLGRSQAMDGQRNQALSTFKRLENLAPQSSRPPVRMAAVYLSAGDYANARQMLKRALEIDPKFLPAQDGLIEAFMASGRPAEAIGMARDVQKLRPDSPVGWELEARILAQQKRHGAAADVMRAALAKSPMPMIAVKLHALLLEDGKRAEADKFAATWEGQHPEDFGFIWYQGDAEMARKNYAAAEAHFKRVVELRPNDALALNNVAWLMVQQGKPGAVAFAERADKAAPNAPALMDTLALALAAEGRLPAAIEIQTRALAAAPNNHQLRLGLAKLYIKAGDAVRARAELETLAKLGPRYEAQAEVARLLKTL